MQSGRFVCHSVRLSVCSLTQTFMHVRTRFFLTKVGLVKFILQVMRIDLHYHLEVTVSQHGHFGKKSFTVAQKMVRYATKVTTEH